MYLVIFDCDGTLVDSQASILRGFEIAFTAAGLPVPPRRQALSTTGLSLDKCFSVLLDPEQQELIPSLVESYRRYATELRAQGLERDPLYPGAIEALDRLSQRDDVLLGLATGRAMRGVKHVMQLHQLEGRFVTIQTADKCASKPNPDMLLAAMQETGADPENTVMIGDTSFDMEMAANAGVTGIGVSWGYHDVSALLDAGAETTIQGYCELDGALSECLGWNREMV